MKKRRQTMAVSAIAALALGLASAPGAWGVTEGWGYDVCNRPSEQIIISSDTQGYSYHVSRAYGASAGKKWSFGWGDYPNPRRATWTSHNEVAAQPVTASTRIMYKHHYCAG